MSDLYEKSRMRLRRERGGVAIDRAAAVRVAVAFPNVYGVAMASLGFQLVYSMLNSLPNASCERVFLPDNGDIDEHFRSRTQLFTIESLSPIAQFDALAFSISFELDYLNILRMLRLANLPIYREERDERHPIVIAGGPCATFNPEPIADFIDAFVIGDAEDVLASLVDTIESCQNMGRVETLDALSNLPGVYVPDYSKTPVRRAIACDLDSHPASSSISTSEAEFGDIELVEISRGCGRQCRFCVAGYMTRPARPRKFRADGAARYGLVGAAVFDHPQAQSICESIIESGAKFTLSSIRLETITPELVALMKQGGQRTLTIAPEAGSDRLRAVINKRSTDDQIISAIASARDAGISKIKLYFMIGLPTETDEDIEAIIDLAARISRDFPSMEFLVSASSFVPKPWTPFQWHPMEREKVLKRRYNTLRQRLGSIHRVKFSGESPRLAIVQGYLARGDREIGRILAAALDNGGDYAAAVRETGIDLDSYLHRQRDVNEPLPWDVIDLRISKNYLANEYEKAIKGETTAPCQPKNCRACGACVEENAVS